MLVKAASIKQPLIVGEYDAVHQLIYGRCADISTCFLHSMCRFVAPYPFLQIVAARCKEQASALMAARARRALTLAQMVMSDVTVPQHSKESFVNTKRD